MADEALDRIGAMLEQLGTRFELVLEAVTGFGGKLEALREEITGQFSEVGRQVRFVADRLAENRDRVGALRNDLGAEIVRLGETLGATRVEFREQLASVRHEFHREIEAGAAETRHFAEEIARKTGELQSELSRQVAAVGETFHDEITAARSDLANGLPSATADLRDGISLTADALVKKVDTDLKQTNKLLANLARKFEHFDDRITIQTKDQDQRIKKLERQKSARG